MNRPDVSIVIPSHNEGLDVVATVDCILRNSAPYNIQLIVVDDGSTDKSPEALQQYANSGKIEFFREKNLGAIGARNLGASFAKASIIGFIDAHCYTPKGWLTPLMEAFDKDLSITALSPAISCTKNLAAVGYGATWKDDELAMIWLPKQKDGCYEVPFIGGAGTFIRRSVFEKLKGFDDGIVKWGYEDMELSIRLWLFGYRVTVVTESVIYHKFRKKFRYDLDYTDGLYNKLRLIFLHFDGARFRRLVRYQLRYHGSDLALKRLYQDGSEALRENLFNSRMRTMDAFCNRFNLVM